MRDPALRFVQRIHNEEIIDSVKFLNRMTYRRLLQFRGAIRERLDTGIPAYRCPICRTNLYIVNSVNNQAFFRHESEKGNCPIKTRGHHSRAAIKRMLYAGQRESSIHLKLKALIETCLSIDPAFSDIIVERRLNGESMEDGWRKPDIYSQYKKQRVVFEAQVNSTFLDVILARRRFYRSQRICLTWIMPSFNPLQRRLAQDDIITQHKGSAFVVDEETQAISISQKQFMLRIWRFHMDSDIWTENIIPFKDLILEPDKGAVRAKTMLSLSEQLSLKDMALWLFGDENVLDDKTWDTLRTKIQVQLVNSNVDCPKFFETSIPLRKLIRALETASTGYVFGWKYDGLNQVAHLLAESDLATLSTFIRVLRFSDHYKTLLEHDKTGNWVDRERNLRAEWSKLKASYQTTDVERNIAQYLYPELSELI